MHIYFGHCYFAVVACMITFFIKTYLISPFHIIFWWLWTFCNYVIFRSTSKTFSRCPFRSSVVWSTSRTSFSFYYLIFLKHFYAEWLVPPQKVHLVWTVFSFSLFLSKTELLSRLRLPVCKDEIFNDFWSIKFSSILNSAWWLVIQAEYFPPWWKLSRNVCISWSSE